MTAEGKAGASVRDLVEVVGPPLRFLASAARGRLAPDALPTAHILGLIGRVASENSADEVRASLDRLRVIFETFPLDDARERRRRAEEGLRELDSLSRSPAPSAPPPVYRQTVTGLARSFELLSQPVQFVKGVGPRRAEQLARLGVERVEDLLYHLPFRYEDRRQIRPVGALENGDDTSCVVEIVAVGEKRAGRRGRSLLEARATDGTGALTLTWFHHIGFFARQVKPGARVLVHGRVQTGYGRRQIVHPELEVLEGEGEDALAGILPVYAKPGDMHVRAMRKIVAAALDAMGGEIPSVLPDDVARRRGVVDLSTAFEAVHRPTPDAAIDELLEGTSIAHRSIVFDELFFLELGMCLRRNANAVEQGIAFAPPGELARRLTASLPWQLTGAQRRVREQVAADMSRPHPMNRLVQGDVGSGKTIVAVLAALDAVECGYQVGFMAPTEILAEQHFRTVRSWLEPLGLRVDLLTGSVQGASRRAVLEGVADGSVHVLVGTHAIIQEAVRFHRLGLGIIDEQHRFGVLQRRALRGHGENPDILLMTATPIPRTLALTLYGDLDLSFVDELPPGRQPVETRVVAERDRERIYAELREEIAAGRQAFLVFPLVEESEDGDLRSARTMAEELARGPLRGLRLGLLHGQMKGAEKDAVMRRFQSGDQHVLVATTVVEVGIDIPNATLMVIDHAEQFGLAQLHQLRGRVGRGGGRSRCVLVSTGTAGRHGFDRLRILERESKGSKIAEADLVLRGPGQFLGVRQSGLPDFRAANLVRDMHLLEAAREEALRVVEGDPSLASESSRPLLEVLLHRWKGRLGLAEVG